MPLLSTALVKALPYIERERHEGLVYAGASFGMKLAAGLGAVIASLVMDFGGYINNAETQTEEAMDAILYATSIVPAILFVLAVVSILGYRLDKIYPDVIKELQARKAQSNQEQGPVDLSKVDNA